MASETATLDVPTNPTHPPVPRATYRLQVSAMQPFARVCELVDYLADMGFSHLYLSPFLTARPGTQHFYNVADHSSVDAVLGGEDGLRALAERAHDAGMGLIGDIVPHHMGVGPWSPIWEQLLSEGRSSEVAGAFDVDWESPLPGAADKVILPVLGESYGDALNSGLLEVREVEGLGVRICYGDLSFPVNPESAAGLERSGLDGLRGTPDKPLTWSRMHGLLERQHYRLVSGSAGARLVNYRRFVNVDELAALRVEDEAVFQRTHTKVIELVHDGVLDGLRIDHVDGLADPRGYLQRLREAVGPDKWLVVESITSPTAGLPEGWPVNGTTGYETLRTTLGMHVDPFGLRELALLADEVDGRPSIRERWRMKTDMLDAELGPDLRRCTRVIWAACQNEPTVRDVDYRTLLEAVSRLATAVDGYRCHVDPATGAASAGDRATVSAAVAQAREDGGRGNVPDLLWTFLEALLTGQVRWTASEGAAVARFQQLTPPISILGIEERLFASHHVLAAACELGTDPDGVTRTLDQVHEEILAMPPHGMRTTATHDTKHSEDVRLRMAALTGMARDWTTLSREILADHPAPEAGLGVRLLQVAIGIWPAADDGTASLAQLLDTSLGERLADYAIKVARSQARITTHRSPNHDVETTVRSWAAALLDPGLTIAERLRPIARRAGENGMASSLSQTLIRLTLPGSPDTYQGTERWDDSLSDPDNRRPVDFDQLIAAVPDLTAKTAQALWDARHDGRVKQHVMRAALGLRARHPEMVDEPYHPMAASGRWAAHTLVYGRGATAQSPRAIVVAPRVFGRVTDGGLFAPLGRIWADTDLVLPGDGKWRDVLTGATHTAGQVALAEILHTLPVALLEMDTA